MKFSVEKRVAIFFLVGLVALLTALEMMSKGGLFVKEMTLLTRFGSAQGLKVGDPVKLSGVEVGQVADVRFAESRVEVIMEVREGVPVRRDSQATVKFASLLGVYYVDLTFGSLDSPLARSGDVIAGVESPDLSVVFAKLEKLGSDIGQLFGERLGKTLTNIEIVTGKMASGEGTIGKLITDESLYQELKATMTNMKTITQKITEGEGTIGRLVNDGELYTDVKATMSNLKDISTKVNNGEGTLGKVMTDDALYKDVREAAASLKNILKKIENGEGTIGKLVAEDNLYQDAREALKKLNRTASSLEEQAPLSTIVTAAGVLF